MLSATPRLYISKSGESLTLVTNNNDLACDLERKMKVSQFVTNGQVLNLASDYHCCPVRPAIRTAIFGV
jgi:hypothetical protein